MLLIQEIGLALRASLPSTVQQSGAERIYFNSGLNQAIVAFFATGNYVIADSDVVKYLTQGPACKPTLIVEAHVLLWKQHS